MFSILLNVDAFLSQGLGAWLLAGSHQRHTGLWDAAGCPEDNNPLSQKPVTWRGHASCKEPSPQFICWLLMVQLPFTPLIFTCGSDFGQGSGDKFLACPCGWASERFRYKPPWSIGQPKGVVPFLMSSGGTVLSSKHRGLNGREITFFFVIL